MPRYFRKNKRRVESSSARGVAKKRLLGFPSAYDINVPNRNSFCKAAGLSVTESCEAYIHTMYIAELKRKKTCTPL